MINIFSPIYPDVPQPNCKEIYDKDGLRKSGLYRINLKDDKGEFTVFCDMNLQGGGWTIIQRRVNNVTDFNRNRDAYNIGFGDFNGSFWLGLEKIKRLTDYKSQTFELYLGFESFLSGAGQDLSWAKYGSFGLGTSTADYALSISQFDNNSPASDSLTSHNGEKFSTPDDDNDSHNTKHCAEDLKSGWWYHSCHDSHLNGVYHWNGVHPTSDYDGIIWESWLGNSDTLKTVVMAVRPA